MDRRQSDGARTNVEPCNIVIDDVMAIKIWACGQPYNMSACRRATGPRTGAASVVSSTTDVLFMYDKALPGVRARRAKVHRVDVWRHDRRRALGETRAKTPEEERARAWWTVDLEDRLSEPHNSTIPSLHIHRYCFLFAPMATRLRAVPLPALPSVLLPRS